MIASANAAARYRVLDAWRGICACLVAFIHVPVAHGWQDAGAFHSLQLFVDFFFLLSGFVICHAYGERLERDGNWTGFMIRRFGRVYPLHIAALAGFVTLELFKVVAGLFASLPIDGAPFTGPRSLATLLSNLVMTQSFGLHGMTSWNGPAWSIGVEFYTYAVFAGAVLITGARSWVFLGLAVLGLAVMAGVSPLWLFATHDYGFWRCLYGFFLGCLVCNFLSAAPSATMARLAGRGRFAGMSLATVIEIASVAVLAVYLALTGINASSLAAPLVFAGIVLVFAGEGGAISRMLLAAPAQTLGLWSYSIYMIHMLLFAVLKIVMTALAKISFLGISAPVSEPVKLWTLGGPVSDAALVAVYLGLVLVLAKHSFDWIEAPARAWFARLADRVAPPAKRKLATVVR
ncbi:MAG: acyltransferase [Hyphomicrobiaceae bacterium]